MPTSFLKRLLATHSESEIWWDASPLTFVRWRDRMLEEVAPENRASLSAELSEFFDPGAPHASLVRGATTNPTLVEQVVAEDPALARAILDGLMDRPLSCRWWDLYLEIGKRGADALLPMWQASGGRYGWISLQIPPDHVFSVAEMLRDADELRSLGPNVMVKVPGTSAGYHVLERLTADGVATNNTLTFSVPQFVAYLDAVDRGLERRNSGDPWRSVFTFMTSRFGMKGDLLPQAEERGMVLSQADVRAAEMCVVKRLHAILQTRRLPVKILLCSLRVESETGAHGTVSAHLEHSTGGGFVYTCPPSYLQELMGLRDRFPETLSERAIDEPPPAGLLEKLAELPYFRACYETDGMKPADFDTCSALLNSLADVAAATERLRAFVAQHHTSRIAAVQVV